MPHLAIKWEEKILSFMEEALRLRDLSELLLNRHKESGGAET